MAFGQTHAVIIAQQRTMVILRHCVAECANEQNLAEGRFDEVGATHDFGDAELGVIDRAGELITGHAVFAPHEEVSKITTGHGRLCSKMIIVEGECFAIGHAEAPVRREPGRIKRRQWSARRGAKGWRVNGFVVFSAFVRSGDGRFGEFTARVMTREDQSGGVKMDEGLAIAVEALSL